MNLGKGHPALTNTTWETLNYPPQRQRKAWEYYYQATSKSHIRANRSGRVKNNNQGSSIVKLELGKD